MRMNTSSWKTWCTPLVAALAVAVPACVNAGTMQTCNGLLNISYPVVQSPNTIGSVDTVQIRITTGAISGGSPQLVISQIVFDLDCTLQSLLMSGCTSDGNAVSYVGDSSITTNCTDGTDPVEWTSNHGGGDSPNTVVFTASSPAVVAGSGNATGCFLRFNVQKTGGSSDSTPSLIEQRAAFSASCTNGGMSSGSNSGALPFTARATGAPAAGPLGLLALVAGLGLYGMRVLSRRRA